MSLTTDAVITCISSALHVCEVFLLKHKLNLLKHRVRKLRLALSNLKTFVLICGRELGSDASLRNFLGRIEDTVRRNKDQIHLQLDDDPTARVLKKMAKEFIVDIKFLEREIDEWYDKVLDDHTRRSATTTSTATADEICEIITSFLNNLLHFRSKTACLKYLEMEQQISFLKSLIVFVSKRGVVQVEPLQDLSAHIHHVTILLAPPFLEAKCEHDDTRHSGVDGTELRTDFHAYKIYARALSSSKLRRPLLASTQDVITATKDFLDSLISDLWDLLRLNTYSYSSSVSFKNDLKELYQELRSLRVLVKQQQQLQWPKIKDDIGEVVCDAGVFICSLHQTHTKEDHHLVLLQSLSNTLKSILVEKRADQQQQQQQEAALNKEKKQVTTEISYSHIMPSQGDLRATSSSNETPVVVGFHNDQTLIVDRLTKGSRKLQIVGIVGMPGVGKTTLATRVYTNPCVLDYFSFRAWTVVSQVVDKKKVLLHLFNQIDPTKCSQMSAMSEPDVADYLRKSLKGRKYLIFLDDMWDVEAWHSLRASFPDDNVGSRIILTSRRHDVAPSNLMVDGKPHTLCQLNEEESVELFQKKISSGNGLLPPLSWDLGKKIAEKCRGLPLMIVIVAGVLKAMEPEDWNAILDGMRNDHLHYRNTLELSYNHLPAHLRPFFLYFGAFKEDEEVSVGRMFRLWIAEGFVPKDNTMRQVEAAETYLRDLIGRSLIMVVKQRSDGGVKTCRIHDLLHEFCIQKAKEEGLFHFLRDYDELSAFNEPTTLKRLCIQSKVQDLTQSRLYCPRARSLIFYPPSQFSQLCKRGLSVGLSSTIQISKHLTVLDLEQVYLGRRFPTEVEQLVQLAFLAIRCTVREIPSWIGNLSNLETFILHEESDFSNLETFILHEESVWFFGAQLPDSFWKLQKLQYLNIHGISGGWYLPKINFESSSSLDELDRFSGAKIRYSKMENQLEKIRNIRRLKCIVSCGEVQNPVADQVSFEILKRLESLHLTVEYQFSNGFGLFSLPPTLKKLTLKDAKLSWRNLSAIGNLPKLEVLKLHDVRLEGKTWEMKEGEFPYLRILKLFDLDIVKWITNGDDDDYQLGCLEKLVLDCCGSLEELPYCLDIVPTLEVIEVFNYDYKQIDLVKQIKERREKIGSRSLKIVTDNIQVFRPLDFEGEGCH